MILSKFNSFNSTSQIILHPIPDIHDLQESDSCTYVAKFFPPGAPMDGGYRATRSLDSCGRMLDPYLVDFEDPMDALHPSQWPTSAKVASTLTTAAFSVAVTFSASGFTFRLCQDDEGLTTTSSISMSIYLLGYFLGTVAITSISRSFGRRLPMVSAALMFCVVNTIIIITDSERSLIISDFFLGFCGACPHTLIPDVYVDIYADGIQPTLFSLFLSANLLASWVSTPKS